MTFAILLALLAPLQSAFFDIGSWAVTGTRVQVDSSARIWDGMAVSVQDLQSPGMAVGSFPSFVSLTYKSKTRDSIRHCGGTLYKRAFILTAAHCAEFDVSEYDVHAYLNPYINPFIIDIAYIQSTDAVVKSFLDPSNDLTDRTFQIQWSDIGDNRTLGAWRVIQDFQEKAGSGWQCNTHDKDGDSVWPVDVAQDRFPLTTTCSFAWADRLGKIKDDMRRGLGLPLSVRYPAKGSFGILHQQYKPEGEGTLDAATFDVALLPLASPPFPEDSGKWSLFQTSFGHTAVGSRATVYGLGAARPSDMSCGNNIRKTVCQLRQKTVKVLSYDACHRMFFEFLHDSLSQIVSMSDEELKRCIIANQKEVSSLTGQEAVDEAENWVKKYRAAFPEIESALSERKEAMQRRWRTAAHMALGSSKEEPSALHGSFESAGIMLGKLNARLGEMYDKFNFYLAGVQRGSQICTMNSEGSVDHGDSGGPLVDADGGLVGITSWVSGKHGNLQEVSFGNSTRILRMPAFFASADFFSTDIDRAIRCLGTQSQAECQLGPS